MENRYSERDFIEYTTIAEGDLHDRCRNGWQMVEVLRTTKDVMVNGVFHAEGVIRFLMGRLPQEEALPTLQRSNQHLLYEMEAVRRREERFREQLAEAVKKQGAAEASLEKVRKALGSVHLEEILSGVKK